MLKKNRRIDFFLYWYYTENNMKPVSKECFEYFSYTYKYEIFFLPISETGFAESRIKTEKQYIHQSVERWIGKGGDNEKEWYS